MIKIIIHSIFILKSTNIEIFNSNLNIFANFNIQGTIILYKQINGMIKPNFMLIELMSFKKDIIKFIFFN